MSGKHVTARVSEDLYDAIESIREEEQTDRSTAIKRLLQRGVDDWTVEAAVWRYRDGDLSLGAASEFADLSVWRFLDVLEDRDVEINYTEADLADDLAAVTDR